MTLRVIGQAEQSAFVVINRFGDSVSYPAWKHNGVRIRRTDLRTYRKVGEGQLVDAESGAVLVEIEDIEPLYKAGA